MDFNTWAARHPHAAAELLADVLGSVPWANPGGKAGSEAAAQQSVRMKVAQAGGMAWRNNVGATPAKCPDCGVPRQPIRYGLANDSPQLNNRIKSADLILAIPRVIQPQDVGHTIAQFGSVETKRPGWKFTGKDQENGQAAWLALIKKLGGFACFSTGDVEL